MRARSSFLFFLLLAARMFSQDPQLDSLKKVLSTQGDDTTKVNTFFAITEICPENDILKYAQQGLALAQKLNYKKGVAKLSLNVGYGLNMLGEVDSSLAYFHRGLQLA